MQQLIDVQRESEVGKPVTAMCEKMAEERAALTTI